MTVRARQLNPVRMLDLARRGFSDRSRKGAGADIYNIGRRERPETTAKRAPRAPSLSQLCGQLRYLLTS